MNTCLWRTIAIIGLALGSSLSRADEAQVVYYDIVGNSARELRNQMRASGPIGKTGKRFDGRTKWHVSWKYRYAPTEGGCRFTRIDVRVTGSMILPRWAAGNGASSALARKWQRFVEALRLHEDGHYSHGIQAGEAIRLLGESFRVSEKCSEIGKRFAEEAHWIIEKYNVTDVDYDLKTRHGRTQGALFP